MQFMAEYKNFSNPSQAQELLLAARDLNHMVMKPVQGIQFSKLNSPTNGQGSYIIKYMKDNNLYNNSYILHVHSILDNLKFSDDPAKRFEQALEDITSAIGIFSSRPEIMFGGKAPDNLLAFEQSEYVIIECKSRTKTEKISKSDCGQLLQSVQWFKNLYPKNEKYYPVIIHNSAVFGADASPSSDMRIMTPDLLEKFSTALRQFAEGVVINGVIGNVWEIEKLLNSFNLNGKQIVDHYTKPFKKTK